VNKVLKWVVIIAAIGGGYYFLSQKPEPLGPVVIPALSSLAAEGSVVFQGTCATCHGANLEGTETGPSLLHPFYGPNHHGDTTIRLAVQMGARQHHWKFGNMPPQTKIEEADIVKLTAYVREMQRANGVE